MPGLLDSEFPGTVPLGLWLSEPNILIMKGKDVRTPADLAGLKIRVSGAAAAATIEALGAYPVQLPAGEIYNSLQTGLSAFIGTFGLLALVAILLVDVIGRYFGASLLGAQDITQMGLVLAVFGGMALCDRMGGHIAIDIFERQFPAWVIRLGDIVSAFLGAVIFLAIAWYVWESSKLSIMLNLKTNISALPKAWFQYFVVAASVITGFGMIVRGLDMPAVGTLLIILACYLVLGCFLEGFAMLVLSMPIFFPVITQLGIDPIWFGVLVVLTLEMGLFSPPVGVNVFIVKSVAPGVDLARSSGASRRSGAPCWSRLAFWWPSRRSCWSCQMP